MSSYEILEQRHVISVVADPFINSPALKTVQMFKTNLHEYRVRKPTRTLWHAIDPLPILVNILLSAVVLAVLTEVDSPLPTVTPWAVNSPRNGPTKHDE